MIIQPFKEEDKIYYADTCQSLVGAGDRGKIKYNALSRFTYPGKRLTDETTGLNSVGYWDGASEQDWGLDWHRNEGIEIHFLESGNMPYLLKDSELHLQANDMTITRPWQSHKVGNPEVGIGKMYWLILDVGVRKPHMDWIWPDWIILSDTDLERLTLFLRQNEQAYWKGNKRIRDCFQKLGELIDSDVEGSNSSKLRFRVNELFLLILDLFDQGGVKLNPHLTDSHRSVELFISELSETLQDPWTTEEMAKASGLGITRFTYIFKQITNQTPMQYLNRIRLEMAKQILISKPDKSIADISFSCGFSSSQYFATSFKKHLQTTPNEYRLAAQA
ncbi:helix-turn-helix transcriptional regulator [Labilibaculum sp. DW002]|uniref:Helix-turn-helix transcriptional regulator n=1 Tax=Paralabilibaculum antarcticum TaxID=2912572 RepID=A0ABT5VPH8_9BACT|nr:MULTISPECIES: helix-turn-helix transcriptional regulator [unclassified Labilibaculum]MBI9059867.1 helix-turn-helix transcriptional regulator [Labilibaculum sp.]MDE5417335.1 helix-turn-helix transcriptional regulator [Labilibaculum sp. DW002]